MYLPALYSRLSAKFRSAERISHILSLSLLSGIPLILSGKGGYGKTAAVLETMKVVSDWKWGMLEASPETTASDFLGGAAALTERRKGNDLTKASYDVEASMLVKHAFFVEEMLDASFNALCFLKALITNKGANVNGKWVSSQLVWLVGATNIDPVAMMEELPVTHKNSYDAFLQRFLIVPYEWDSHTVSDYNSLLSFEPRESDASLSLAELLSLKERSKRVEITGSVRELLCELAAKSTEQGSTVSPRNFLWGVKLLKTAAFLGKRDYVVEDDLFVLSYVNAFDQSLIQGLEEEIQQKKLLAESIAKIKELKNKVQVLEQHLAHNPSKKDRVLLALSVEHEVSNILTEVVNLKYDDSLSPQIRALKETLIQLQRRSSEAARDNLKPYDFFSDA